MRHTMSFLLLTVMITIVMGCASTGDSVSSDPVQPTVAQTGESNPGGEYLWGLYDISFDPETGDVDIVPMRTAELEYNVVKFLEQSPTGSKLTLSDVQYTAPVFSCTVGIEHPFPEHPELTGFSVRGVVLTDGSLFGFTDPDLVMSGPGELRLTNLDGYTRWWNPVDFPSNGTVFRYYPGKMGNPNGGTFTSTINPYKLFADSLDEIDDNLDLDESMKSAFTSGTLNKRRYILDFGSQPLSRFQYAVIASHEPPLYNPPIIPDDFPPGTVASEPWSVETIELMNTLYHTSTAAGGELQLQVRVKDFEKADEDRVFIEAPGIFPKQEMPLVSQTGIEVVFETMVMDVMLPGADAFDILVTAVAPDGEGFNGLLPGKECAVYAFHTVDVLLDPVIKDCPEWPFYDDFESYNCVWTAHGGDWWGEFDGYMDASGGGDCYEEDTGEENENENVSFVTSPQIEIPESDKDLVIRFNHTIDVDPVNELLARWAWDMCFVRVNGEQVFPTGGPPYEDNHLPYTFFDFQCWTGFYDWTESEFNLGTEYNGTTIEIDFVLDTFDYILNCDPPFFGWLIDDISVEFVD